MSSFEVFWSKNFRQYVFHFFAECSKKIFNVITTRIRKNECSCYLQIEASFNIIGPLPLTSVPISLFPSGFPTSFLYECSFSLCVLRVLPILLLLFFCRNIIRLNELHLWLVFGKCCFRILVWVVIVLPGFSLLSLCLLVNFRIAPRLDDDRPFISITSLIDIMLRNSPHCSPGCWQWPKAVNHPDT